MDPGFGKTYPRSGGTSTGSIFLEEHTEMTFDRFDYRKGEP
jgi:hypothetical protein